MSVSINKIEEISRLARLKLTKKEKEKIADDLSEVLDYIEQIRKIEDKDLEPVSQIAGLNNITRQDVAISAKEEIKEKLISQAPQTEDKFLKVKKIFEG